MKKLLVVLLSLGLIVAFSMKASAADVKFSGQYYVVGVYQDNRGLAGSDTDYSRAFFWTRTRIQTEFKVAEGLTFVSRFDAQEKGWGNTNWNGGTDDKSNSHRAAINQTGTSSTAGPKLQENIEIEYGYVDFKTAFGQFTVGYQATDEWGTVFGDTPGSRAKIVYKIPVGPVVLAAVYEKLFDTDGSATTGYNTKTDGDKDNYVMFGIFNFTGGSAGLLLKYVNWNETRINSNYKTEWYIGIPYMKGQFGPVYVEGELIYIGGKTKKYDNASQGADVNKEGLGAYAKVKVDIGPMYVGGQFGYSSGNDQASQASMDSSGKDKSGPASTTSWIPALIFGNGVLYSYASDTDNGGVGGTPTYGYNKQNLWLWNGFAGFNVTPKFNIEFALSYMYADNKPTTYVSKNYGMEADLKATYKIYDNLSYMVGAGYLWTGDYFKGTSDANKIGNDYLIMNMLTLNF